MSNKIHQNQAIEGEMEGNLSNVGGEKNRAPDAPREELVESLSAMMDDEADSLEIRRVVKSLEQSSESSPELLAHWRRFHVVRASLQHELHQEPAIDLLAAIRTRLADESASGSNMKMFRKPVWSGVLGGKMLRVAGQGLIAASVAAAILVGYPVLNVAQKGADSSAQTLMASSDSLPQMNGDYSASPLTRTVSLDDAARHRLENAVRNFSGTAAVLNSSNSRMFVDQLEPFDPTPSAAEQPAQHR